jgi:hypothetical protein
MLPLADVGLRVVVAVREAVELINGLIVGLAVGLVVGVQVAVIVGLWEGVAV